MIPRIPKNPKHSIRATYKTENESIKFWCLVRKNKNINSVMGDFISASGYVIETDEQIDFAIQDTIELPFKINDSETVTVDSVDSEPLAGYEFKGYTKKRIAIS